jgi:protoporphyrinogen/coproporphyrinogen III oxidase
MPWKGMLPMKSRIVASTTLLAFASVLSACAGEFEAGEPGATDTPFAVANPNLRIAVVGAGPSGLTAAYELQKRGYQNVTVFEREDHVGGKVNTLTLGDLSVELGAVFASPDYTLTLELADEYNIPYAAFDTPRFIYDRGVKRTFEGFLLAHYTPAQIYAAIQAYAVVLQTFPQIFEDGMANLPDDLKLDFDDFAVKYHIEPVAELAKSLIVGFGYGYYDNVPAIYELKILNMLVKLGPAGLESPPYFKFPTGYQSLWKAVAEDLDVRLNSNVTSIKRPTGTSTGPIKVTVNTFFTYDFDAVIVSAPLSAVPNFVTLTQAEKDLFRKVETTRYFITLFLAPGATQGEAVFIQDTAVSSKINHAAVWANPGGGVPVFQAYQIADKYIPKFALDAILAYDILTMAHGVFAGPILRKEWPDYFPRVNSAALTAGFYDQVEALQGNKGLYYVGGTLSFETVETAARYAKSLVDARFPAASIVAGP